MADRPGSTTRPPDHPGGDEVIARLFREAGRRPEVPAPDLLAIREAFDAQWRESVAPRPAISTRRPRLAFLLAAATLLALVSAGIFWVGRRQPAAGALARVESIEGLATLSEEPRAGGRTLREGSWVRADLWLETFAADAQLMHGGRVGLRLAEATLRVDAGSRLRLLQTPRGAVVELARGAVYVDAEELGEQLEVQTPLGSVRDIGTQFETRLLSSASALQVRVRRGEVAVEGPATSLTLRAGEGLELTASGDITSFAVLAYGSEWSWILGLAPGFELDGRSARELLDWVARETGWEVRYADDAAEAAADALFEGAFTVRSPGEEALVWLRGAGLRSRLQDGSLLVSVEAP